VIALKRPAGWGVDDERARLLGGFVFALASGWAIGWFSWGRADTIVSLLAIAALPIAWAFTSNRWEAVALVASYYGAGERGLPHGAVVFFGDEAPAWCGFAMWGAVVLVLCVPYAIGWGRGGARRGVGFAFATAACVVPPFGLVGWLNPLSVAGVLFPAWGWVGLALCAIGLGSLAALDRKGRSSLVVVLVVALAALSNFSGPRAPEPPTNWLGFDTSFAKLSSAGTESAGQLLASMRRVNWLVNVVDDMPNDSVLVLPETLLGRMDGVTDSMLTDAERKLVRKHSRVLVGAELSRGSHYANSVVVLGARDGDDRAAIQGIPVPISMWKPWAQDGATADLLARASTIAVGGKRIGVSICYEQLLAYSLLRLAADRPDVIAAVSNVWWASSTNIPTIQSQSVRAYARLFNVPVVFARNI
jgi:hypothetical protein